MYPPMTTLDHDIARPADGTAPALDVFYDGGCPVCRIEVRYYGRIDRARSIRWIDITQLTDARLPAGKTRDELLGRFHARDSGGWHIGVDAFARIWRQLPVWRRLAFVFGVPGLRRTAEVGYRGFLRWQRWHRARRHR